MREISTSQNFITGLKYSLTIQVKDLDNPLE